MGRRLGIWIFGAYGDVATTAIVGAAAVARGLRPPLGLVSQLPPFDRLELAPLGDLVFGGLDVRATTHRETADGLARSSGLFPGELLAGVADALDAATARVRPGVLLNSGPVVEGLASPGVRAGRMGPRAALERTRAEILRFREAERLDSAVAIHLASTEPVSVEPPEMGSLAGLRHLLARDDPRLPASVVYAAAALEAGIPYVNFTPSLGSSPLALQELAEARGVPHMGRDGKTGETLLKSALAPIFLARNLEVLSWTGLNCLGNRDGLALGDPATRAAKLRTKDHVLREILGDKLRSSEVRIEYAEPQGDWKTAWDHVRFQGFLGIEMSLQFTWRGSDSALAAPLVLDLARLIDIAGRRGDVGLVHPLACFFKDPTGVEEHAFVRQWDALIAWAERQAADPAADLAAAAARRRASA